MTETSVKLLDCAVATSGLLKINQIGAGVGVILFSLSHRIGAGVHILAPHAVAISPENPAMYADTAIPHVLNELARRGVKPPLSVAIAGGATLWKSQSASGASQHVVEAVKDALSKANLKVRIEETGGSRVRSMTLDIDAGKIKVG